MWENSDHGRWGGVAKSRMSNKRLGDADAATASMPSILGKARFQALWQVLGAAG